MSCLLCIWIYCIHHAITERNVVGVCYSLLVAIRSCSSIIVVD